MGQTKPPPELEAEGKQRLRQEAEEYERRAADLRSALGELEEEALELPTLQRAVDGFLARQGEAGDRTWFPWPGTPAGMPDDAPRSRLAAGDVLPPDGGYCGPGWERFWRMVGPLWPDRLAVLVGATGRGKSGFALQVAEAVARAGHPVLFLSAEMGTDELLARLLALRAQERGRDDWGIAWRTVLLGGASAEDLQRACAELAKDCPAFYPWAPRAGERTAAHLAAMARAVVKAQAGKPPLVVVDYLQRMAEGEDLRHAVRSVSGMLRDLSRPEGLHPDWPGAAVLALSSTARAHYQHFASCNDLKAAWQGRPKGGNGEERKEPVPLEGMGKESGELETDASLLLVLTTNKARGPEPQPRQGLMVVAKNRHGGAGTVPLDFYPACGRFVERKDEPSGGATEDKQEEAW